MSIMDRFSAALPSGSPADRPQVVIPPLVGVDVPERGADHLPGGALPVECERRFAQPVIGRTFLPDVVRPAATIDSLAAGQRDHGQECPVDGVGVEPVVGSCPQDDHRTTAGLLGILRELASDPDGLLGRHAGDLLLPGRGVGRRVVSRSAIARAGRRGPRRTGRA